MSLYDKNFHVPDPSWIHGPEEDEDYDEAIDEFDEDAYAQGRYDKQADEQAEKEWDALDQYEKELEGRH